MIPGLSTSGKRKLPGIFRVGGTEYQRMPGIYSFNEKRDQSLDPLPGRIKSEGMLQYWDRAFLSEEYSLSGIRKKRRKRRSKRMTDGK